MSAVQGVGVRTESCQANAKAARANPAPTAQRNRERLMEAAKAAFAEVGADVSLDEIARRAGVGIGTLYRHFPTRDAIIEAVYRREVRATGRRGGAPAWFAAARRGAARSGCGCSSTISPPRR